MKTNFNLSRHLRFKRNKQVTQLAIRPVSLTHKASIVNNAKISHFIQNSPLAWVTWDPLLKCIEWNKAAEKLFGISRDEAVGKPFATLIQHGSNQVGLLLKLQSSLLNRETSYTTCELLNSDGNRIICKWHNTPLYDNTGVRKKISSQIVDLTIQEKSKEALDNFFEHSINMNIIAGLDGVIKKVNSEWFNALGYSKEELVGVNFIALIHPDDIQETLSEMDKLSEGQVTFNFENRYRHKNGEYRRLRWKAKASPSDKVIYACANDITNQ